MFISNETSGDQKAPELTFIRLYAALKQRFTPAAYGFQSRGNKF
jgi:hypothetical protein